MEVTDKMQDLGWGLLQIAAASGIAIFAYRRKSLEWVAALCAILLSILLYFLGGPIFLWVMLAFFITSSVLSMAGKKRKDTFEKKIHAHTGARGLRQVLANSAAALVFTVIYFLTRSEYAIVGFFSAFAACNADTWASEWGGLSRRDPISILTGKPVQRGLSGGVTALGFLASALGSLTIAAIYGLFRLRELPLPGLLSFAAIIFVAGCFGSVIDSVLGDTLQAKYLSDESGTLTEKPFSGEKENALARGFRFVTNDVVNLLSSALAAVLGFFCALFLAALR